MRLPVTALLCLALVAIGSSADAFEFALNSFTNLDTGVTDSFDDGVVDFPIFNGVAESAGSLRFSDGIPEGGTPLDVPGLLAPFAGAQPCIFLCDAEMLWRPDLPTAAGLGYEAMWFLDATIFRIGIHGDGAGGTRLYLDTVPSPGSDFVRVILTALSPSDVTGDIGFRLVGQSRAPAAGYSLDGGTTWTEVMVPDLGSGIGFGGLSVRAGILGVPEPSVVLLLALGLAVSVVQRSGGS